MAVKIWSHIVKGGMVLLQIEPLTAETGKQFFSEQSFTGIACDGAGGDIVGLYTLRFNNVGHHGHIYNISYAVKPELRGCHTGGALMKCCMGQGKKLGSRVPQFNAVVGSSVSAFHMYEKLGFTQLGVIPGNSLMKDGSYEDIISHYHVL